MPDEKNGAFAEYAKASFFCAPCDARFLLGELVENTDTQNSIN